MNVHLVDDRLVVVPDPSGDGLAVDAAALARGPADVRWWMLRYDNVTCDWVHGPSNTTGSLVELLGAITHLYIGEAPT